MPNKSTTDKPIQVVDETSTTTLLNKLLGRTTTTGATDLDPIELLKKEIKKEYKELKKILQYFFKKKIVKILDIDIENITNKNFKDITTLQKIKTELENKMKKDEIEIKKKTIGLDKIPENTDEGYDKINKDNLYQLLSACYEATVFSDKMFASGTIEVYSTFNFINYIINCDDDCKFLNIFKFSSNKSDFYYNFTKSVSDAGNVKLKVKKNGTYYKYCNATGENLNNSNKIKEHFKITFSDENILNDFEKDVRKDIVIDFINKNSLSPTERI